MSIKKRAPLRIALFLTIGLVIPLRSLSAVSFPDTPSGNRASEILALLNGTSEQSIKKYIQLEYTPGFRDAFPQETHISIFQRIKTSNGRMHLAAILTSNPHQISFTLKSDEKDAWLNINLQVETEKPYRISSIGIRPGSQPDNYETEKDEETSKDPGQKLRQTNPVQSQKDQVNALDRLHQNLTEKKEKNEFSGVVLIAKGGKPIFHKAYGYASKRFKVLNRLDTRFNLGSCNKLFTAFAVLKLMQQGKLSLDDPIGKHLDLFPEEISNHVLIRHLLSMRSGWGDYWGNEIYRSRQNTLRTISDYMDFIKEIPLAFEPGSNFKHSNIGYMVAGALIEKISGMDYYTFIRKNIYEPAGMMDSGSFHRDGPVENLAMGYTNANPNDPEGRGYKWSNVYLLPPRGKADGGGYASAGDLLKLDRAIRNNLILNQAYTNYWLNRYQGKPGDPYVPERIYRAVGGAPGVNSYFGMDFKSGFTVIVLSNYDMPVAIKVADEILELLGLN
jgi:CubicO group peptidase (beta-lactamase class C family)